jgi:hypothetical protein
MTRQARKDPPLIFRDLSDIDADGAEAAKQVRTEGAAPPALHPPLNRLFKRPTSMGAEAVREQAPCRIILA